MISALPVRFQTKIRVQGDCWEWTGWRNKTGHGRIQLTSRKPALAHRAVYELLVGPIPEGLTLDHLCRNRPCVNPAHLEPVDMRTNILRGVGPTAVNAKKVVCIRGHALAPNRYHPGRFCPTCDTTIHNRNRLTKSVNEAPKKFREACNRGHLFTLENTLFNRARRLCRTCAAERYKRFKEKRCR